MKKILTGLLALLLITQSAYAESPSESAAQPVQQEMQQETQDEASFKTQRPVLKAASYDVTKIKISWEADAGADGYILYRKAEGAKSYQKIYTAGSSKSGSYIDIGRTCGKTYCYKLKAYREDANGKVYAKASQVKKAHARPRKPVITSLFEKKEGFGEVELRWKPVSGASGYQIAVRENGTKKWYTKNTDIFTVYRSKDGYAHIGCNTDYPYEFKVRAYKVIRGKRIYSLYSAPYRYHETWTNAQLKQAIEERLVNEYGAELNDIYISGEVKTPENSSWSTCWPMNLSKYAKLEDAVDYVFDHQYTHFGLKDHCIKVWIDDHDMYCSVSFLEG